MDIGTDHQSYSNVDSTVNTNVTLFEFGHMTALGLGILAMLAIWGLTRPSGSKVRRRALQVHFVQLLHNIDSRSGNFMEDLTLLNSQKVAHRVEYRLNALFSGVSRFFELFEKVNDHVEEFARKNPKETADLVFQHRHSHRRHLVQRHETSKWSLIHPQWVYPLQAKRFELITVMIAMVTAVIAASVVTIFTVVELDRLIAKQQKADTVEKLGLMASK
jgi:hypothetical protein